MAERGARPYPPVGDPDRLESILQRGHSLRRRRQWGAAGAGAGGVAVVVAVAVFAMGGGQTEKQLVADDGTTTSTSTTELSTTTTELATPSTEMTVAVLGGSPAEIRIDDPEQPVGEGTQQCVLVTLYPQAPPSDGSPVTVAEGTACAPGLSGNGMTDVALVPTTSSESGVPVEIGCAATAVRPSPDAVTSTETAPGSTIFRVSAPDVPAGTYRAEISAASGVGDGCPPADATYEREHVAQVTAVLSIP